MKMHKFTPHGDRELLKASGQTAYEYYHSTACGYVRDKTTQLDHFVTCKLCLRELSNQTQTKAG